MLAVLAGCGGGGKADASFRKLDDVRLHNQIAALKVSYVRTPAGRSRLEGMVRRYAAGMEADADLWGAERAARMLDGLSGEVGPVCGECAGVLSRAAARVRA